MPSSKVPDFNLDDLDNSGVEDVMAALNRAPAKPGKPDVPKEQRPEPSAPKPPAPRMKASPKKSSKPVAKSKGKSTPSKAKRGPGRPRASESAEAALEYPLPTFDTLSGEDWQYFLHRFDLEAEGGKSQIYISQATKQALKVFASKIGGGARIGYMADRIIRWFLLHNLDYIKKRKDDPIERLKG
jgi:hypothetical protein